MTMAQVFELAVNRALLLARALERALHDPGPWTVRIGAQIYPACRVVIPSSRRVIFYAYLHDAPAPGVVADLYCRDAWVSTTVLDDLPDAPSRFEWELSIPGVPAA